MSKSAKLKHDNRVLTLANELFNERLRTMRRRWQGPMRKSTLWWLREASRNEARAKLAAFAPKEAGNG